MTLVVDINCLRKLITLIIFLSMGRFLSVQEMLCQILNGYMAQNEETISINICP